MHHAHRHRGATRHAGIRPNVVVQVVHEQNAIHAKSNGVGRISGVRVALSSLTAMPDDVSDDNGILASIPYVVAFSLRGQINWPGLAARCVHVLKDVSVGDLPHEALGLAGILANAGLTRTGRTRGT